MARYDTNLAAEYYVLSCLHRLGLTANLTLGNKKGVDIVVVRDAGDAVTVEVKGVAKKYDWPVGNLETKHPDQHFVALVSFEDRIDEADMPPPRVWVLPFPGPTTHSARSISGFERDISPTRNSSESMVLSTLLKASESSSVCPYPLMDTPAKAWTYPCNAKYWSFVSDAHTPVNAFSAVVPLLRSRASSGMKKTRDFSGPFTT